MRKAEQKEKDQLLTIAIIAGAVVVAGSCRILPSEEEKIIIYSPISQLIGCNNG